jgi:hypothetical protein
VEDALAAVRRHHDQVALVLLGGGDHRLGDQVGPREHALGLDAFRLGGLLHRIDHRLALLGPLLFGPRDFGIRHRNPAFEIADRVARHHIQRDQFGPAEGGLLDRALHGFLRQRRAVGGNEDALVHSVFSCADGMHRA